MAETPFFDIMSDKFEWDRSRSPAFVTFGEVMVRDTPADTERPERTRLVHLSMAGSEYTLAIGLDRLGIPNELMRRWEGLSPRPRAEPPED